MGFRIVVVSSNSKLNIENRRLHIIGEDNEARIPVEDLDVVVLENHQSVLTSKVLAEMATEKVAFFICDSKHMPCGVLTPFQGHSRQLEVLKAQMDRHESFNKRCWQLIIQQKIKNQAWCLEQLGKQNDFLLAVLKRVKSGDIDNREAVAAVWYFKHLLNFPIKRHNEDSFNAKLNYGYSIVRGIVSRSLVSHGFIPSLGIKHRNELNAFNLADDFLEVIRPLVDRIVVDELLNSDDFTKEHRFILIGIINRDVKIENKLQRLSTAIDVMISSYKRALLEGDYNFLKLIDLYETQGRLKNEE